MKMFLNTCLVLAMFFVSAGETSADVRVTNNRGTLTLKGDANADQVEIVGVGSNEVEVFVNGDGPDLYENVQNIRITMARGADSIVVEDLFISGNLDINMGGDLNDYVEIRGSEIGGNLNVTGGSDITVVETSVGRNLTLTAGTPVDMDGDGNTILFEGGFVGGRANIRGSNRSIDLVNVTDSFFAADLSINLGGGSDMLIINDNFVGRNLTMDGGAGIDIIQSDGNLIGGRITLRRFEIFF